MLTGHQHVRRQLADCDRSRGPARDALIYIFKIALGHLRRAYAIPNPIMVYESNFGVCGIHTVLGFTPCLVHLVSKNLVQLNDTK